MVARWFSVDLFQAALDNTKGCGFDPRVVLFAIFFALSSSFNLFCPLYQLKGRGNRSGCQGPGQHHLLFAPNTNNMNMSLDIVLQPLPLAMWLTANCTSFGHLNLKAMTTIANPDMA
ncbi:hypothetical protein IQ07DRAFT_5723 [Pyrenochaeta sp. DS3sAY3a]|nr:hypothetical protein IQ07DRAFT_5723 [Pyrenochaeta sp. DS3sAY3a]